MQQDNEPTLVKQTKNTQLKYGGKTQENNREVKKI